ncbi:MAG: recombinase family protein [Lachnospiraceae bacterium]|nr:recombinase family protein [Lachnospiraceae bacterium]
MSISNLSQGASRPSHYMCAAYVRISKEDEDAREGVKDESNSIANQRNLILDFISDRPELELYDEYADDGYSGVNFERPDFKRMMDDVRARKINCIIVKDLSRFGRNYIEAGKYLEQVFPFLGVRFIAITDSIDTGKEQSDAEQFVLPFKNLFNDAYCKDISTKVRSQLAIKRKNGDFVGSFACYGYLKDPADHNKLIIDPEASEIVRYIFYSKIHGLSADRIAEKLNEQGVLCPMEYKHSMGLHVSTNFRTKGKAEWAPKSVMRILTNEVYIGITVQGKMTTPSYKVKRLIEKPEEEWDRVEGTHEPIVPKEVFDEVQMLMGRDTRIAPDNDHLYLFGGFLCCADCGMSMTRRRVRYKDTIHCYYACSGYRRKSGCTSHNISETKLYAAVLAAVNQQITLVLDMERLLRYAQDLPDDPDSLRRFDVQLTRLDEEISRNQSLKASLYDSYKQGTLTEADFKELSEIYTERIKKTRQARLSVEAERDGIKGLPLEGEWLTFFKKYQNVAELDRFLLADLVEVIEVHADKAITIRFKFMDQIRRVQDFLASCPALQTGGSSDGADQQT